MAEGYDFTKSIYDDYDEYYDDDVEEIPDVITDEPKLPDPEIGGLSDIQELQLQMKELEVANVAKQKAGIFFKNIKEKTGLIPTKKKL